MLSTFTDSGLSPLGHDNPTTLTTSTSEHEPQVHSGIIDEYKTLYLQCAAIVQCFMSQKSLETYEDLYQLGCEQPDQLLEIDKGVGQQLKLSAYGMDDRIKILFYGPYIQSQMHCHFLSEEGAKTLVRENLQVSPIQPLSLSVMRAPKAS